MKLMTSDLVALKTEINNQKTSSLLFMLESICNLTDAHDEEYACQQKKLIKTSITNKYNTSSYGDMLLLNQARETCNDERIVCTDHWNGKTINLTCGSEETFSCKFYDLFYTYLESNELEA